MGQFIGGSHRSAYNRADLVEDGRCGQAEGERKGLVGRRN